MKNNLLKKLHSIRAHTRAGAIVLGVVLVFTLCFVNLYAAPVTVGNFVVDYVIQSDWGGGATISVTLTNNGPAITGWTVGWTFPGNQTITSLWNGTYTQSGASVSVKDAGFNASIATGGSANFGCNVNYSGTNAAPTSFTVNSSSTTTPTPTRQGPTPTPTPTIRQGATSTPTPTRTSQPTSTQAPTPTPTRQNTPTPTTVTNGNWYVAPSGNDSNNGSQSAPFQSITKAQSVASSGQTVYLRGGTYTNFTIAGSDSNYNFVHNITKSGITYAAYPGETVTFDFTGTTTAKRVAAFHIANGVTNVTFRGFKVTGVPVGSQKQSECFRIEGAANFDGVTCCYNQANGFYFTTNGSGSCTNCDSYENIGVAGTSIGNTDGFGAHAYGVTFSYCRSWHNSDDGYDCIASYRSNTFDHCWAYNMTAGGDSNGFKIGGWGSTTPPSSVPVHTVRYCLSANNGSHGFYANHQCGQAANWTYNTVYNNSGGNFDMLERVSTTDATDIPGTREVLHYNIAYVGTIIKDANLPAANVTDNSWTKSGITVSGADFQSVDATQMTLPRNSDGSLPSITFMHLAPGSDLAGLGCF